ncbi:MAG: hypothetical protein HC867_03790 [Bacteroidia bacterium]|nr:hypothetical protein [Bacteroidia bacterium]
MKKVLSVSFLFLFLYACNNTDQPAAEPAVAEDDLDAARSFIRASLDGNMGMARKFLFEDSVNLQYFNAYERSFVKQPEDSLLRYKSSSIRIHDNRKVNDSTTILIFSNSFKNDPDTLKIVRLNDHWLVDLKYLFEHAGDTLQILQKKTDSLQ